MEKELVESIADSNFQHPRNQWVYTAGKPSTVIRFSLLTNQVDSLAQLNGTLFVLFPVHRTVLASHEKFHGPPLAPAFR
jgi:hypothetical protein